VFATLTKLRNVPALRLTKHFHDHPDTSQPSPRACASTGRRTRAGPAGNELSRRTALHPGPGRPYHCECQKTGRLLAEALGWTRRATGDFQSRFGRAEWLKPYTFDTVQALGRQKLRCIDVVCPGSWPIAWRRWKKSGWRTKPPSWRGGGEFRLIPCLNERQDWIHALADLALENVQGCSGAA